METNTKKIVNCKICGGAALFYIRKNNYSLFRCCSCDLIFVDPAPTGVNDLYGQDYFSGASRGFGYTDYDMDKIAMVGTFEHYLKTIEKYSSSDRNLLDVGAATGFFMNLAQQRGWTVKGVEISNFAAEIARAKGLSVFTGGLQSFSTNERFSAITMLDVIEHVNDPTSQIRSAHDLLLPGGLLAINTPDTSSLFAKILGKNWHLFVPPEHIFYFNHNNLKRLLTDLGFEVIKVEKNGKKFTIQYILQTLARWLKLNCLNSLAYKIKGTFLGNLALPINLRDNFFIIGRKKI